MVEDKNTVKSAPAFALEEETGVLIELLYRMLAQRSQPNEDEIPAGLLQNADFAKLWNFLVDLRTLSTALGQGELETSVKSKGFVLSNLKALQSSLRHLTWQTQRVASGDFSQRVDFLGDFSRSFNVMTNELRSYHEEMTRLASYDPLTQIPNRLSLEEFSENAFEKSRITGRPLSFLMLDIDHFKLVNDSYGHTAGDAVLVGFAKLISSLLRSSDFVARYGGEEFVIVLPDAPLSVARQVAHRILNAVRKLEIAIPDTDKTIHITASIGVSGISAHDTDYAEIIDRCDKAMYDAKILGRDRIVELVF